MYGIQESFGHPPKAPEPARWYQGRRLGGRDLRLGCTWDAGKEQLPPCSQGRVGWDPSGPRALPLKRPARCTSTFPPPRAAQVWAPICSQRIVELREGDHGAPQPSQVSIPLRDPREVSHTESLWFGSPPEELQQRSRGGVRFLGLGAKST